MFCLGLSGKTLAGDLLTQLQLVAVTAEWLVDSITGLTASGNISLEFISVILLPIVGNAAGAFIL